MLGSFVTDRLTGFKGCVVAVVDYLDGHSDALVQPLVKTDGSFVDAEWIPFGRFEIDAARPAFGDSDFSEVE